MPEDMIRRKYPRYESREIVTYSHGGSRFLTVTVNLGLGGMRIETPQPLPKSEPIDVQLILGETSIRPKGRVVYSQICPPKGHFSGIQSVQMSELDRSVLQSYFVVLKERIKIKRETSLIMKEGRWRVTWRKMTKRENNSPKRSTSCKIC